jgi:hypothetical protein
VVLVVLVVLVGLACWAQQGELVEQGWAQGWMEIPADQVCISIHRIAILLLVTSHQIRMYLPILMKVFDLTISTLLKRLLE